MIIEGIFYYKLLKIYNFNNINYIFFKLINKSLKLLFKINSF